jgi:hypothetical protein
MMITKPHESTVPDHIWTIIQHRFGTGSQILLDGEPLRSVRRVTMNIVADAITECVIELVEIPECLRHRSDFVSVARVIEPPQIDMDMVLQVGQRRFRVVEEIRPVETSSMG